MPENLKQLMDMGVLNYIWIVFLSVWAGTAKYLSQQQGRKITCLGWLTDAVTSGFVGVCVAMLCAHYQLDGYLTSAIVGVAAHNGAQTLALLRNIITKKVEGNR